ncbi:ran-binding protein 3 isoform X2 [Erinaceus europaeus]|uniref:Ran-binding protein 3 isoform X2 n=1 Tax=Erinaceus europaeus TaxID=9365 RepID=A0ABM3WN42_ERIEU|nr:ran-binding protein 3 isoform X2 [Erinaceus europaeus]
MADLANEDQPTAISPPVFAFQKDKDKERGRKPPTEQPGLADAADDSQGAGSPEPAGRGSAPPGRPRDSSSPEGGEDSDHDDGSYCPPLKRERTSSQPEEKSCGFRLKPPTLIHGQAPSAGLPSLKPKEQQRSVLRPAVLQAPQPKTLPQTVLNSSTNGVAPTADGTATPAAASPDSPVRRSPCEEAGGPEETEARSSPRAPGEDQALEPGTQQAFVFGQNLRDRVKLTHENADAAPEPDAPGPPGCEPPSATNYFLQYISASQDNPGGGPEGGSKFVFGQNMSERVLSPPKPNEAGADASRDSTAAESGSESTSQEAAPEKESLAESAAAYTKATARGCLLEKVDVVTGEEAESNVLQMQCKLFVFDKTSQSWVERGRGLLRLNDMAAADDGALQSRLVMRTQGSLRLILNTKLWARMQVDKASEKSVRLTASDAEDQAVRVFLISASSKDTGQLFAALHHRILALRSRMDTEPTAPAPAPVPARPGDDSDEEERPRAAPAAGAGDEGPGQPAVST